MRKSFWRVLAAAVFLSFLFSAAQAAAIEIPNPLKHQTFEKLITAIIKFLQELALVVTAIVIVLAGFYFVTSAGDPAKVTRARQMILYAAIGLFIILLAQAIIALIETVIKGE